MPTRICRIEFSEVLLSLCTAKSKIQIHLYIPLYIHLYKQLEIVYIVNSLIIN